MRISLFPSNFCSTCKGYADVFLDLCTFCSVQSQSDAQCVTFWLIPSENFQVWCHDGCSLWNATIKFFATISKKQVRIDRQASVLSSAWIFYCTWRTSPQSMGQANPWPSGSTCTNCLASISSKSRSILQCFLRFLPNKATEDASLFHLPKSHMLYSFHRIDFLCSEVVDEIDFTKGSTSYLWTYCVFTTDLSLAEFHCLF